MGFPRYSLGLLAFVAAAASLLTLAPSGATPAAQKARADDAVKVLLKERVEVLTKIHDMMLTAYQGGETSLDKVLAAHVALLNGKLDLCETKAERVKVHEGMVQVVEELVKHVRKLVEGGHASRVDALKAEVQLLDARVGLERAKAAK